MLAGGFGLDMDGKSAVYRYLDGYIDGSTLNLVVAT